MSTIAKLTVVVTVIFAPNVSEAADLSAPIDERPTVGTEILRGYHAAITCDEPLGGGLQYSRCILDAASADEQRHANFAYFELGLFYAACEHFQTSLETDQKLADTNDVARASLPENKEQLGEIYRVFHADQRKSGVTDAQLVAAITDYNAFGKNRALNYLKQWAANPPVAAN